MSTTKSSLLPTLYRCPACGDWVGRDGHAHGEPKRGGNNWHAPEVIEAVPASMVRSKTALDVVAQNLEAQSRASKAEARVEELEAALFECAKWSGEDVSEGRPTWPDIAVWAVEAVKQARADYDEALKEIPLP